MVYKVCEFKGIPRIKISEEPSKTTIAGAKSVLRAFDRAGAPIYDVLCLKEEFESILGVPEAVPAIYDLLKKDSIISHPFRQGEDETSFGRLESVSENLFADG